jgi:hypothetical protein
VGGVRRTQARGHVLVAVSGDAEQVATHAPPTSEKPALHEATPQTPAAQEAVPLVAVQALPQRPQFATLVRVSASQPLVALPSQSAKPVAQVLTHADATHEAVAFARMGHTVPQAPQCAVLVRVSVSHPFVALVSQSPKPVAQVFLQAEATHAGAALARVGQALPQALQFVTLVRVSVSQPLVASRSQLSKPVLHVAMAQAPAMQDGVPLAAAQALLQRPQCVALVAKVTSQPLVGSPSQSPKPAAQVYSQRPAAHAATAPGRVAQAMPQPPQCATVLVVSVSQPLVALPSQFSKGATQLATAQAPLMHAGAARGGSQRVPHAPQFATLAAVSTQAPLQQVCPVGQARMGLQPGAQTLPAQSVPAGQCVSLRHSTQARVATLQRPPRGVPPSLTPASPTTPGAQPSSSRQPGTQRFIAPSQ